MDFQHRLYPLEATLQPGVLPLELLDARIHGLELPATLPGRQARFGDRVPLATPGRQLRGVQPLTAKEGSDITVTLAGSRLAQDAQLVLGPEPPSLGSLTSGSENLSGPRAAESPVGLRPPSNPAADLASISMFIQETSSSLYTNFRGGNCLMDVGTEGGVTRRLRAMCGPKEVLIARYITMLKI